MEILKLGICQVHVTADKKANIENGKKAIEKAASMGSNLIILPEMWVCPYKTSTFCNYSEKIPDGETCQALSECAKKFNCFIIGGSIPELGEDGKLYNTSPIFDPKGNLICKHRKIHLFDIDVAGKDGISFKESDSLTPGNSYTIFETPWGKIGVGICFDIRFSELSLLMREKGCSLIVFPGAFNMCTGPAHWEISLRMRAVDTQCYVCGVAPARDSSEGSCYVSWAHSSVVDPWGNVIKCSENIKNEDDIFCVEINQSEVKRVRGSLPIIKNKRNDLYEIKWKKE